MSVSLKSVSELVVLDLGSGMAPALAGGVLGGLGARVVRIEPAPTDLFTSAHPAYEAWYADVERADVPELSHWLERADVCLLGGESHPDVRPLVSADEVVKANPKAIVLDFEQDALDHGLPAHDLLAQARSGLCFEQYGDRPVPWAFPAPTYGAAMLGLVDVVASLIERRNTGRGSVLRARLSQGAALWCVSDWVSVDQDPYGITKRVPRGVQPLVFECLDGAFVHLVMGVPGAFARVSAALDLPWDGDDTGVGQGDAARGVRNYFFPDFDRLATRIAELPHGHVMKVLREVGIAVERVEPPGVVWDDEQTKANEIIEDAPGGWERVGSPIRVKKRVPAPSGAASKRSGGEPAGLERLRVVDLSAYVAGPLASKLLSDLGTDVIKVEPPGGDPNRGSPHFFAAANRGKRSIVVNAKSPEGLEVIRRLCDRADIVHQNFRAGVAERLGVDPASLRGPDGSLVTLEAPGYGSRGPKVKAPAFDPVMQAICGFQHNFAGRGNLPAPYRHPVIDYGAGVMGTLAMLLGVLEQRHGGGSVEFEVSLYNVAMFMMSELVRGEDGRFVGAKVLDSTRRGFHPWESLYETEDGWIALVAPTDSMARALATALDLADELGPRRDWAERERDLIAERISALTTDKALEVLHTAGVWASACVTDGWREMARDPQAHADGSVVTVEDPDAGTSTYLGGLPYLSVDKGSRVRVEGPRVGEHTRQILLELGYEPARIEELYETGAVQ